VPGGRAVLEPVRLRQRDDGRDHQRAARAIDSGERTKLYRDFQELAARDQPLIVVAEFTFITVARTSVRNVANNPRWATSHWADTWLAS
jgi:peptide/nickel transport system substrate-binding protein